MNGWFFFILSWIFRGGILINYYINFTDWYSRILLITTISILILIDSILILLLKGKRLYINQGVVFHITLTLFLGVFLLIVSFCIVALNSGM
jgi:hypothetical protein